ncbi:MAG TPA: MGMT family protein, partial [Methanothrix sp.]|nr:MGMT family protein [Methanothrix sp.]
MTAKIESRLTEASGCPETSQDVMGHRDDTASRLSRRRSLPEAVESAEGFFLEPLGLYLLLERCNGLVRKIGFSARMPEHPIPPEDEEAILRCWLKGEPVGLELDLMGLTEFQREVLEVTSRISPGETMTYDQVAERIGRPKAARAVGQALGKNPFPLIIPCHRV